MCEVHIMSVRKTKWQNQWWIKGDNAKDDLMKFPPRKNRYHALWDWEKEMNNRQRVTAIFHYKRVMSPAKAAMTCAQILAGHAKKESTNS